jgi:hypothetical protein
MESTAATADRVHAPATPPSRRGWPWLLVPWAGFGAGALVAMAAAALEVPVGVLVWLWLAAPGAYTVLKIVTIGILAVRKHSFYCIISACLFPSEALVIGLLTLLLRTAVEQISPLVVTTGGG